MLFKSGKVFLPDGHFEILDVYVKDGIIKDIGKNLDISDDESIYLAEKYLVPGYVDIHTHGSFGMDFCDESDERIEIISKYLGSMGITSFLGTTMSFSEDTLTRILSQARKYVGKQGLGAVLRGINLEGPFINMDKKGAQNGKYIINPDIEMFERLFKASGESIKIVDVAPETDHGIEFIEKASKMCHVSLAHTNADFDTAEKAFKSGATNVTHLFNAMPPFNHRNPSVVGAAADNAQFVELISDGIHVHPSMIRGTFKLFSSKKICLISDSMRACGLKDGEYTLGGQNVTVNGAKATLSDGTIAGSVTCLAECVRKAVSFGIKIEDAIMSATLTPSKAAKIDDITGSIEINKSADLQILDENLMPINVFVGGKTIV